MVKRILSLACMLAMVVGMFAQQQPQMTPLPLNPEVKHGVLPNGLTYYILHNEEPKNRANFYIAQKVGSTLETPEQLGLAHFLEHMAFNGTSHYPGKKMLEYLQSKGIRFGADINAYTSFDETVYNINNVPTSDKALMDSVLLILHDWSGSILLEEDEIDAERGVIQEEWRQRNDANNRMLTAVLPQVYDEYQYQQMPIGKMEVVMNFKPEVLRAYYKKWYRPDQQGIVIVGDFDAAEMEKKVIELFSKIVMPENAAERTYPTVSDNEAPKYAFYEDPELRQAQARVSFKYDKIPFEMRNTVEAYMQENVIEQLTSIMINNRLEEYGMTPECKYAVAGIGFNPFLVAKTKGSFDVVAIGKGNNVTEAMNDALAVVARACKTGFTDSELERAKSEVMANYEKSYNERNKTNSEAHARELIRAFIDNEAAPGIETEYQIIKQVLPMIPIQAFNEFAKTLMTPTNQVIIISQPKTADSTVPVKETVIANVENALNAEYEAMAEEKLTEPLIDPAKMSAPGKIKSTKQNAKLGTTEMVLSNGAKVIVKPTDFASDEILFTAFKNGGKRSYDKSQAANVALVGDVYNYAVLGNYDIIKMRRFLSGKKVSLGYEIGNATNILNGSSTKTDLETLMSLVYVTFNGLTPDRKAYQTQVDAYRPMLEQAMSNPNFIFQQRLRKTEYGNNPMMNALTVETLDAANYDEMFKMLTESMSNAADYTFIFTGNVDVATLKPLLEKYVASLPGTKATKSKIVTSLNMVQGQVNDTWQQPMETPSTTVYNIYSGKNLKYTIENSLQLNILADILANIYTATLREEEGGTYGADVVGQMNPNTGEWMILYAFQTNKLQQDTLMTRAYAELVKLLNEGAKAEDFNKVKEAALKQYENNSRTNAYWNNNLLSYARGWDMISNHRAAIENLTLADFNKFMKGLYDGKNRIQVVMEGVEAK